MSLHHTKLVKVAEQVIEEIYRDDSVSESQKYNTLDNLRNNLARRAAHLSKKLAGEKNASAIHN